MKYTKEQILKAAELGEVSMIDANHIVSLLDEVAPDVSDEWQNLMNDIAEWSDRTFGDGQRNPAIVYHLKKEVDELIGCMETGSMTDYKNYNLLMEYADCLMLLLDSATHCSFSAKDLIEATQKKLEINKNRKWGKPDKNGVVEHIKSGLIKSSPVEVKSKGWLRNDWGCSNTQECNGPDCEGCKYLVVIPRK